MGVVIEDIRIYPELVGATPFTGTPTNYLLGNIGEKVKIEVDFRAEEILVSEALDGVDRIMLAPQPFRVNVPDSKDVIFCESIGSLAKYRVGDDIGYDNTTSGALFKYTIYEKISDQAVRVHQIGGSVGDVDFYAANGNSYDTSLVVNSFLVLLTDLTSVNYKWNFVGNLDNPTFENKIDNETNFAQVGGVFNTDLLTQNALVFANPKTNNIGSAYVVGNGSVLGRTAEEIAQKFTIVHETVITPFILAGRLQDLKDRIAPDEFESSNALKHILSIDVGRNISDPNHLQTIGFNTLSGNTGWFDENFNGGATDYYIDNIVYKRADTSVINSVELVTADQTVEITIKNNFSSTFSDGNTNFTLNFSVAPDNEVDYLNNGKTVTQNFYFDRALNTMTSGFPPIVAGENLGTDEQIFTEISALYVNSFTAVITAKINLSANGVADLIPRTDLEYFMWVGVQKHTLDTEASDRVSLIADIQPFFVDLTDDGMINISNKFLEHYQSDVVTQGSSSVQLAIEDDVLSYSQFTINRSGRETDEILINSIGVELLAKKTDGSEFTLESYSQSFSGTNVIGDSQYILAESDRSFRMPDGDQRKHIKVNRRSDLDTVNLRYYEIYYPFIFRFEYWKVLANTDGDAFDIAEPNNGQNQDWQRYDSLADWDIYYRVTVNATKNGNFLTYQEDSAFTTFDYTEGADWDTELVESFDADTLSPLNGLIKFPTKIIGSKNYIGGGSPTVNDVEWRLNLYVFENGTISDVVFLSSVYDWTQYSYFKSVDASNKVVKDLAASTFSAEALIDFDKLPEDSDWTITARVYETTAVAETFCILQSGGGKILQTGGGCIEYTH